MQTPETQAGLYTYTVLPGSMLFVTVPWQGQLVWYKENFHKASQTAEYIDGMHIAHTENS